MPIAINQTVLYGGSAMQRVRVAALAMSLLKALTAMPAPYFLNEATKILMPERLTPLLKEVFVK